MSKTPDGLADGGCPPVEESDEETGVLTAAQPPKIQMC